MVKALTARNMYWSAAKVGSMSRLQRLETADRLPGALPQAVALRTFGAERNRFAKAEEYWLFLGRPVLASWPVNPSCISLSGQIRHGILM